MEPEVGDVSDFTVKGTGGRKHEAGLNTVLQNTLHQILRINDAVRQQCNELEFECAELDRLLMRRSVSRKGLDAAT